MFNSCDFRVYFFQKGQNGTISNRKKMKLVLNNKRRLLNHVLTQNHLFYEENSTFICFNTRF